MVRWGVGGISAPLEVQCWGGSINPCVRRSWEGWWFQSRQQGENPGADTYVRNNCLPTSSHARYPFPLYFAYSYMNEGRAKEAKFSLSYSPCCLICLSLSCQLKLEYRSEFKSLFGRLQCDPGQDTCVLWNSVSSFLKWGY